MPRHNFTFVGTSTYHIINLELSCGDRFLELLNSKFQDNRDKIVDALADYEELKNLELKFIILGNGGRPLRTPINPEKELNHLKRTYNETKLFYRYLLGTITDKGLTVVVNEPKNKDFTVVKRIISSIIMHIFMLLTEEEMNTLFEERYFDMTGLLRDESKRFQKVVEILSNLTIERNEKLTELRAWYKEQDSN